MGLGNSFQKQRGIRLGVLGLLLAFGFQNCTGGFKTLDFSGSDSSSTSNSTLSGGPEQMANPGVLYQNQISELQSISVKIDGTGPLTFPEGMPAGALFDESLRRLNWIPKRGQAGDFSVKVFENGKLKGSILLKVTPVTDTQLQTGGPPFFYSDGDVGYIFVHGKGELDRCAHPDDLVRYWGSGPDIVAPDVNNRLIACYDGRKAVASTAPDVAKQILQANCGRYNKCIIFTHSMGGLMLEHMFTHTRAAGASDPEPSMFLPRELYQAVKDRTLFVVSLASAAGGSDAASIVNSDGPRQVTQEAVAYISRAIGTNNDATRNLVVSYATHVVAPFQDDPGIPFFMVAGFSEKTVVEESGVFGSVLDILKDSVPRVVFNGDRELASLDTFVQYQARSDGLVDFRSSCGVASDLEGEGPGRDASLEEHFRYCWQAPKKANHYVWFLANLNHYLITGQPYDCRDPQAPCVALFPNSNDGTFTMNRDFTGLNAMEVIRRRLANPNPIILRKLANIQ